MRYHCTDTDFVAASDASSTGRYTRSFDGSVPSRGSESSADSHGDRSTEGPFDPLGNLRSRRRRTRRRKVMKRGHEQMSLLNHAKKYQCTFCTESFGRKYDWQRHENSVHLPLERWICCPEGPLMNNPTNNNHLSCVFCGLVEPDDAHVENHHYSVCRERSVTERSFNRKDHLSQHLRLFHQNASFVEWSMRSWRVKISDIRSRCGICSYQMTNWEARVNHISEHFKMGKSMADWQGDWGFDPEIANIIENGMPPCTVFPSPVRNYIY